MDIFVNLILVVEYIFTLKNTRRREREKKKEKRYIGASALCALTEQSAFLLSLIKYVYACDVRVKKERKTGDA